MQPNHKPVLTPVVMRLLKVLDAAVCSEAKEANRRVKKVRKGIREAKHGYKKCITEHLKSFQSQDMWQDIRSISKLDN